MNYHNVAKLHFYSLNLQALLTFVVYEHKLTKNHTSYYRDTLNSMSLSYSKVVKIACCICMCADIWIVAAKWEMEDGLSMENARLLLQRGLRFNPTSHSLWQEVRY